MVVAPEHPLVERLAAPERRDAVRAYVEAAARKSELERAELARAKTGVFTGSHALNPAFDPADPRAKLPVFVAEYVLASYGTGAIMSVPGHDERDFEFARAHDLEVREVVRPPEPSSEGVPVLEQGACYTGEGTAVHSGPIDGLPTPQAKARAIQILESAGDGRARVTYRLRDWLFSRQRYWGEPFPLLHRADGKCVTVPDDHLPVELPEMEDFRPSEDGSPPLARAKGWLETVDPRDGTPARRDTDTMPGWAGSCWYWLRFMDPHNEREPFAREAERYWGPVDLYVGGAAHAVLHLLYARFWHKVLFDLGLVSTNEPFRRLFNQGMITAFAYQDPSGRLVGTDEVEPRGDGFVRKTTGEPVKQIVTKMAKSLRNVANPDDIVAEHGADTLRLYELFMGPLADSKPWNPRDIAGCRRFLERAWRLFVDEAGDEPLQPHLSLDQQPVALSGDSLELERSLNRALKRVDDSFERFNFNTAIAGLMAFVNDATKRPGALTRGQAERFVLALSPFAPHVAEELWHRLGNTSELSRTPWPSVLSQFLGEEEIEIAVQVQGKLRGKVRVAKDAPQDEVERAARESVPQWLEGKELVKTVVVPGRLVNLIVR